MQTAIMQTSSMASTFCTGRTLARPASLLPAAPSKTAVVTQALFKTKPPSKTGYDKSAKGTPPPEPAFTRRREIFVGRTAMTGFVTGVIGELLTGKGPIGQLALETNLPPAVLNALVAGIVAFSFIGAINFAGTYSEENQRDIRRRPKGPVQDPRINIVQDPKGFLGISDTFGFTKKNELFVGRMAMLGFAAELIGEKLTGKGALGQIGIPLGQDLNPQYASVALAAWVGFFLFAAIGYGGSKLGETEGDEGIY